MAVHQADQEGVRFIVPVALREVMEELLPSYRAQTGHDIGVQHMLNPEVPDFVASGGAWDVAITNPVYCAKMVAGSHVRPADCHALARTPLAFGRLGGRTSKPRETQEALAEQLLGAYSIAATDAGTSGGQMKRLAEQLGIWERIEPRMYWLGGGGPMRALLAGEVELAALPLTNIAPVDGVQAAGVCPWSLDVHIDLSICVRTGAPQSAQDLVDWLLNEDRNMALERMGAARPEV